MRNMMRTVFIITGIGIICAALTIWYGVGNDLFTIRVLESPDWGVRSNRLALAQTLLNLEAIAVAGASALYVWIINRKQDHEFRVFFLRSLLFEMRTNWAHVCHRVPIKTGDNPRDFWDPRFQEFPMRDDACTYAVTNGQARLHLSEELFEQLLDVSAAVRFVNYQTSEVFSFRFNSPEMLARINRIVRHHDNAIESLMEQSAKVDAEIRSFAQELAFRHWALHHHGYTEHLGPALKRAIPAVEREIALLQGRSSKKLGPIKELDYESLQYTFPPKRRAKGIK
jgi:hypothetical protein